MKKILETARKLSVPSQKLQHQNSVIAKTAFNLVHKEISKYSQVKDVEFGGSYAKGTWLPNRADIDIFIKFDNSTPTKNFVEISKKIGFAALKKYRPYVRYSEHPYVEAKIKNTKVNVVPCYDVKKGEWKSSADRSPYHTQYMSETLTGIMKDEVRLLKKFLINNKIYGSEIAKQGFSGYVTEVLIIHFGSFLDVLKGFADIKEKEIIGKSSKDFDTPIIIMDPVDSNRNLAAAISEENIGKLILASRKFLKKPSLSIFKHVIKKKIPKHNLKNTIIIKFKFKKRSPDMIWGQIKRAANSLETQLEIEGFNVLRNLATTDEKNTAWLLFLLKSIRIDENKIHEGPDFLNEKDAEIFINKNLRSSKLMWIGKNRKIQSLQKREYQDAILFLQKFLKNHLNKSGIPKGLKTDLKKGFKVMLAKNESSKSIKEALSELVSTNETIFYSN